ncbi:CLUMA_CG016446, isoform A [Clunio marinus]|uniref:CLUMA_CG016446, isoform A n=1 Tax=Clunio marinus TaxID=568069 RepID=A0A1J1IYV1_9DIPT|nr:CLUMA_CG016446, isoform A [Clunio marinus]
MTTSAKILALCIFISCGINLATAASSQPISECAAKGGECDESKNRLVCGTDGKTYASRCHLIRAQCNGYRVSLKHRGTCKDACFSSRSYALTQRPKIKFVPKCREDGSYAPIQCLENNGCWCVNGQGKPIPKTHTKHGRPNCAGKGSHKRSSPNSNSMPRRKCSPHDRVSFNTALTSIFHSEYSKSRSAHGNIGDHQVVEWKFKLLDLNRNNILEKHEYQGLRKIAKTVVKPKRCGRRFGKYCDTNKDLNISREEFHQCLSKDIQRHMSARGGGGMLNGLNSDDFDDDDYIDEDSDELMAIRNTGNRLGLQPIRTTDDSQYQSVFWLRDKTSLNLQNESNGSSRDHDEEAIDCLKDRKNALEDKSPIPGSSTKDEQPKCDSYVPVRTMQGCPQKNEFLKDLKEFLKSQITSSTNIGADNTKWGTDDEKIATLSFVLLDKNKNKVWERREWKTFRELVSATKKLRRCGKKMPRYCDVNNDKKITLSEWLNCLQTQRVQNDQTRPSSHVELKQPTQTKLKGINPLESILKAD